MYAPAASKGLTSAAEEDGVDLERDDVDAFDDVRFASVDSMLESAPFYRPVCKIKITKCK